MIMHKHLLYYILFGFFILSAEVITAQESVLYDRLPDDSLFLHAQELGLSGEYNKARHAALVLLNRNADYYDAAVLTARLFAWEEKFDSSRVYIDRVMAEDRCYYDALSASIDVDIWEGNYESAVETAGNALICHQDDELFLLNKARALFLAGDSEEATITLDYLLDISPGNKEAIELKGQIESPGVYYYRENNYLLAGYYGEFLREPYSRRMHVGTAGYSYFTSRGPLIGKINFANTFIDGTGLTRYPSLQYEVESWPVLSSESYLFLNYAYSAGSVFPDHRGAFEIFRNLPRDFEASLGMRFMRWDRTHVFYTGSVSRYYADFWFSLRSYLFPGDGGLEPSWFLNGRKYFGTADDFAGAIIGIGLSPDEALLDIADRLYLRSTSIGFELSKGMGSDYLIRSTIIYGHEEYRDNTYRGRWTFNLALRYYL